MRPWVFENHRQIVGENKTRAIETNRAQKQADAIERKKPRVPPGTVGELGEAAFLHCAMEHGLVVSRPWGNSQCYDFVVQAGLNSRVFHRVQVKCTQFLTYGGYQVPATRKPRAGPRARYHRNEVDFIVGYVIPCDAFYIIPIRKCRSSDLRLYPHGSLRHREKFEAYREAWHLLGGKRKKVLGKEDESPKN